MKTRIIHTKIHFEDEWFNTLPIGYRYLFIYLFTNSHIGQTGAYQLPKRIACIETGATEEEWLHALREFEHSGRIKRSGDWIYIVNSIRYANYSGGKNQIAYKKEYDLIPKEVINTLSIQYQYPMDSTINHKSEIINQKSERKSLEFDEKKQVYIKKL